MILTAMSVLTNYALGTMQWLSASNGVCVYLWIGEVKTKRISVRVKGGWIEVAKGQHRIEKPR